MELVIQGYKRSRAVRLAAGLTALFILGERIAAGGHTPGAETARAFIWATMFLATVLLVWRERNQAVALRRSSEANAHVMAAAETSPNSFVILEAVRNSAGDVVDFRYRYVNSHAEELLKTPRNRLLGHEMCVQFPANRTGGLFDK